MEKIKGITVKKSDMSGQHQTRGNSQFWSDTQKLSNSSNEPGTIPDPPSETVVDYTIINNTTEQEPFRLETDMTPNLDKITKALHTSTDQKTPWLFKDPFDASSTIKKENSSWPGVLEDTPLINRHTQGIDEDPTDIFERLRKQEQTVSGLDYDAGDVALVLNHGPDYEDTQYTKIDETQEGEDSQVQIPATNPSSKTTQAVDNLKEVIFVGSDEEISFAEIPESEHKLQLGGVKLGKMNSFPVAVGKASLRNQSMPLIHGVDETTIGDDTHEDTHTIGTTQPTETQIQKFADTQVIETQTQTQSQSDAKFDRTEKNHDSVPLIDEVTQDMTEEEEGEVGPETEEVTYISSDEESAQAIHASPIEKVVNDADRTQSIVASAPADDDTQVIPLSVDEKRQHDDEEEIIRPVKKRIMTAIPSMETIFPLSILHEEAGPLSQSDIKNQKAVWYMYDDGSFYPGMLTNENVIRFLAGEEITNGLTYPLDICIGDIVTYSQDDYVVVALECVNNEPETIRCIRGYDTVHIRKNTARAKKIIRVALGDLKITSDHWLTRNKCSEDENLAQPIRGRRTHTLQNFSLTPQKLVSSRNGIFHGCLFVVSGYTEPDRLTSLISTNGGTIVDQGFASIFDYDRNDSHCCLRLQPEYENYRFACLISDEHRRSIKYMETLLLGWPTLHHAFLDDCVTHGKLLIDRINSYLLPSGRSDRLGTIKSSNISNFLVNKDEMLTAQLNNFPFELSSYDVIIGATKIELFAKFAFHCFKIRRILNDGERSDKLLVYVDNKVGAHLLSNTYKNARFVDKNWLLQCIIDEGFI